MRNRNSDVLFVMCFWYRNSNAPFTYYEHLSGFISNAKALTIITTESKEIEVNVFVNKKFSCFRNVYLISIPKTTHSRIEDSNGTFLCIFLLHQLQRWSSESRASFMLFLTRSTALGFTSRYGQVQALLSKGRKKIRSVNSPNQRD